VRAGSFVEVTLEGATAFDFHGSLKAGAEREEAALVG